MLQSQLLTKTVQLTQDEHILFLNSAADPFVALAAQQVPAGRITLAEDNVASLQIALQSLEKRPCAITPIPNTVGACLSAPTADLPANTVGARFSAATAGLPANDGCSSMVPDEPETTPIIQHVAFHEYTSREPPATIDSAIMNMLYQPGNVWIHHGLALAAYALKPGGLLYVVGAKDRGVQTIAKKMQERFGNVETLEIHKGYRVVRSRQLSTSPLDVKGDDLLHAVFAQGKLDEGTRLLIEALQVRPTDEALDIGCGAGYLGLHIARLAYSGSVTMVDASLAAVAVAQQAVEQSGLANSRQIQVLPSNGVEAVAMRRFDLVVTNPPFHTGGIQTSEIAEQFMRGAARVLRPGGRFYLVANRFLKYEPVMREYFKHVEEVGGNSRYKVLRSTGPYTA